MVWSKKELSKIFETRQFADDPDFDSINGDWCRTKREEVRINCDELRSKTSLTNHEKYELQLCEITNF